MEGILLANKEDNCGLGFAALGKREYLLLCKYLFIYQWKQAFPLAKYHSLEDLTPGSGLAFSILL